MPSCETIMWLKLIVVVAAVVVVGVDVDVAADAVPADGGAAVGRVGGAFVIYSCVACAPSRWQTLSWQCAAACSCVASAMSVTAKAHAWHDSARSKQYMLISNHKGQ